MPQSSDASSVALLLKRWRFLIYVALMALAAALSCIHTARALAPSDGVQSRQPAKEVSLEHLIDPAA